jgi:predicted lipoprotein with Yx(FWY)xxD motif
MMKIKRMPAPARVAAGVGGAVGAALLVAACSSGSSSTGAAPASSSPAGGSSSSAAAPAGSASGSGSAVITTASSSGGTFLTDGGRAVYLWAKDGTGMSACSGACAGAWPPVTTSGSVTASGAAKASDLGTITRSDGTRQVTYDGHPLYFFAGDSSAGMASGQGSDSFGAKWWLVSPAGSDVTAAVSSFTTGGSGSGSSPAPSTPAATHSSSAGGGWS